MKVIDCFRDEFDFLSNFSQYPAAYDGVEYRSGEHAFAAAKTLDRDQRAAIALAHTAGAAKAAGRRVQLRPDWDRRVRFEAMREILASKFTAPALATRLTATGDLLLIEGNTWRDGTWGRWQRPGFLTATGGNELGWLLMRTRTRLRGLDPAVHWPRAALTGHREHLLAPDTHAWVRDELARIARKLCAEHATTVGCSGMATGADTWWAEAVEQADGMSLWAYRPFSGQSDRWSASQQDDHRRLLDAAARVVTVGTTAEKRFLFARNEILIGDADVVIAVRDRRITSGGTVAALAYNARRRPVITLDVITRRTSIDMGIGSDLPAS
ncbi:NADAR family protein [Nocardia miyunensis]|uniref:NADAR family protein n=1 Tax=Nocardia miyunensis TaxID=282684 RepID=UPI00082C2832|nr:NADAR family protein [Nocardia miyunensis]